MARKLAAAFLIFVGSIWCALLVWKSSFDLYTVFELCPAAGLIGSGVLLWRLSRMRPRAAMRAFVVLWSVLGSAFFLSEWIQANDLVVRFSSHSVSLSPADDPEAAADRSRVAFRACGEVVHLSAPFVESPSILAARYLSKIALDEPARVADWEGRRFEFRYDKYGLPRGAPQCGDHLCFYFDADGRLLDVLPSRSRLARELQGAEDAR